MNDADMLTPGDLIRIRCGPCRGRVGTVADHITATHCYVCFDGSHVRWRIERAHAELVRKQPA